MATKSARKFNAELTRLYDARTYNLRSAIWASHGAAPQLTKKKIQSSIGRLESIAEAELLRKKFIRRMLSEQDYKKQWHPKRGKGFGRDAKKTHFKKWYERHITTKNCIYVFWQKRIVSMSDAH